MPLLLHVTFTCVVALVLVSEVHRLSARNSKVVGITTASYDGKMTQYYFDSNGYDDARDACQFEFGSGSRVCTQKEVGIYAQSGNISEVNNYNGIRFIDMSFAEAMDGQKTERLQDCQGFTSNDSGMVGRCIPRTLGGPIVPTTCPCSRKLSQIGRASCRERV